MIYPFFSPIFKNSKIIKINIPSTYYYFLIIIIILFYFNININING